MQTTLQTLCRQLDQVLLGKPEVTRLALTGLLAGGHLLIEDVPGVGKTTLAHALAISLGLKFSRVQFTADMLPGDITGSSVFDKDSASFRFRPGPIFSQVLLADEINRASPKTQSALLEAMEEKQVSADGTSYRLPRPFFVIATQNPLHQEGTFPLPESQLDRFMFSLSIGYPDAAAERALLEGQDRRALMADMQALLKPEQLKALQEAAQAITVSPSLLDYVQALIAHSRQPQAFAEGLSPRAGLALLHAARAWALLQGRNFVLPEDVQKVWLPITRHRIRLLPSQAQQGTQNGANQLATRDAILLAVLKDVDVL